MIQFLVGFVFGGAIFFLVAMRLTVKGPSHGDNCARLRDIIAEIAALVEEGAEYVRPK